jgi:hypothetical protein
MNVMFKRAGAIVLFLFLLSCQDEETFTNSATINGEHVIPQTTVINDTGTGILLQMRSNNSQIRIWITKKQSGTFSIFNTSPANIPITLEKPEMVFALAEYIDEDGKLHYGVSGLITITIGPGFAQGSFSFEAESKEDDEVTITEGNFSGTLIKPVFSSCAVNSITRTQDGLIFTNSYGYDEMGRLVSIFKQDGTDYFRYILISYFGSQIIALTEVGFNSINTYVYREYSYIVYESDKIKSILQGTQFEATFLYNSQGLLSQVNYNSGFSASIEYDADENVISTGFSNYDTKNNYSVVFLNALDNQQAIITLFTDLFYTIPSPGSRNNPTKIGDFDLIYEYNSSGYPVSRSYADAPSSLSDFKITYRNCP